MKKTVIQFRLGEKDIDRAIREVKAYKQELLNKLEIYRQRLADEISTEASRLFDNSVADDIIKFGTPRKADVTVSVKNDGNVSVIVASGEDAIWCEFGAGVYHNDSVGSSSHPKGNELGFKIGTYGFGHGKQASWGFYEDGEARITRGTQATMPMYNSVKWVTQRSIEIAREVFK